MATQFNVIINLTKHTSDPLEALAFRHGFEDAIHEYGIGEIIWGGAMTDGSSVYPR